MTGKKRKKRCSRISAGRYRCVAIIRHTLTRICESGGDGREMRGTMEVMKPCTEGTVVLCVENACEMSARCEYGESDARDV